MGWLGLGIAAAGGIVVLTGGSAVLATKLFAVSALAEAPVIPIRLYQGDLAGAGLSTLLVLVDGDQIARAFRRTVERAGPALKVAKLNAGLGDLAADFADFGFVEVSNAIKLRGVDVVASQGGDLAYARFKIVGEIEADLRPLTLTPQQAEFVAKRYFDDLVSRLDDTSDYDEAFALFNANPAAADAYVRWGNKAFDPVDGPGLIEFVSSCRALCDVPVDAAGALKLSAVDAALRQSNDAADVARVTTMLKSLSVDERVKFGDVLVQSWVDADRGATIAKNASLDTVPGLTAKEAREKSIGATKAALAQRADVADAALGNSQYLTHFEEDYDWLVKTFEWRSHLQRIDPAVPPTANQVPNPSWYESPDGLIYGYDFDPKFASRVDHVLNHSRPIVRTDTNQHGVPVESLTPNPLLRVDEVYRAAGSPSNATQPLDAPIKSGWTIPAQPADVKLAYPIEPCTRVILRNGPFVITAFPWSTC